jgi:hypothetical protein
VSTAQLAEDEFPARTALKGAQERLAAALAAADAAASSLARGKEHLGVLERLRDEAKAEIVDEARSMAETFAENGVVAMIGGAAQRGRELADEFDGFKITFGILIDKNKAAQHEIFLSQGAVADAVRGVIAEETRPLLARMWDCERAAALLRLELHALQYSGRFGLCPESLPDRLRAKPANIFDLAQPLAWDRQQSFNKRKAAWCDLADRLREDADALLTLGD